MQALARRIAYGINRATTVTPAGLLATAVTDYAGIGNLKSYRVRFTWNAAAEYEEIAAHAPTPEAATRLREKAKRLIEIKPATPQATTESP